MKRLLALVGLLVVCASPVAADYLFIKIDLNKVNFSGEGSGGAQPGGIEGAQPGGPPGFQQGGAPPGIAGAFGGKGKGMMKGAGPPGGLQGPGGQPPGGLQLPGGQPPGAEGGVGGGQAEDTTPHYILAVVPLTAPAKPLGNFKPVVGYESDHVWGRKGRFPFVEGVVSYNYVKADSVAKEFGKKYAKVVTDGKDAVGIYNAASWALAHGLVKDFHRAMETLAKVDANHFAVKNYQRVQAELKQAPGGDDPATQALLADLKDDDYKLNLSEGGHYGILVSGKTFSPVVGSAMKRRLSRFELAYENFFYWFALQEKVEQPVMPKYRLYAVLLDDKDKFHARHLEWSRQPMQTDGFTPRRDNLIVLSGKRLDENYAIFEKNVQSLWSKGIVNRDDLVTGAVWDKKDNKFDMFTGSALQTLALVQKSLDDDSERATISHEATRQLLLATGVLPRLVNVPEWIQSGMASYFDTPYGALYSGVGLPSWSHLIAFKHYRGANRVGGTAYEALMQTITNKFFRDVVREEQDQKDRLEKETQELREANEIAQCTAWALVYHIIQDKKLPQLMQYTQELSNLPRDLDLSDATLQACFARAFNLTDARDPRRLDAAKASRFANDWFNKMNEVSLEVIDAQRELLAYRFPPTPKKKAANTPTGPAGAFPGGANPGIFGPPGANPNAPPGKGEKGPRGG